MSFISHKRPLVSSLLRALPMVAYLLRAVHEVISLLFCLFSTWIFKALEVGRYSCILPERVLIRARKRGPSHVSCYWRRKRTTLKLRRPCLHLVGEGIGRNIKSNHWLSLYPSVVIQLAILCLKRDGVGQKHWGNLLNGKESKASTAAVVIGKDRTRLFGMGNLG